MVKNELVRKSVHLLILLIPLTYTLLGKWQSLLVFAPLTIIFVSLDYSRRTSQQAQIIFLKLFSKVLRQHELQGDKLCGASWTFLATCICFFLFKPEIAVTAFVILAVSDTCASLIGKSFISAPFFEKSFAGSMAFFISAIIVLFICGNIYHTRLWFYLFGAFAIICTTIIEARPSLFKLDDNFTIPISFALTTSAFDLIWNYHY